MHSHPNTSRAHAASLLSPEQWSAGSLPAMTMRKGVSALERLAPGSSSPAAVHDALEALQAELSRAALFESYQPASMRSAVHKTRHLARRLDNSVLDREVHAVQAMPDGLFILGAGDGQPLTCTISPSRRVERRIMVDGDRHTGPITRLAALPEGGFVSAGADGRLLRWRFGAHGEMIGEKVCEAGEAITDLQVVGPGRVIFSSTSKLCAVSLVPGAIKGSHGLTGGAMTRVSSFQALPCGDVVVGREDGSVLLLVPQATGPWARIPLASLGSSPVSFVRASPNGLIAASIGHQVHVIFRDPDLNWTSKQVGKVGNHAAWLTSLVVESGDQLSALQIVPDGRIFAAGPCLTIFDPIRPLCPDTLWIPQRFEMIGPVSCLQVLPDGSVFVGRSGKHKPLCSTISLLDGIEEPLPH